MSTIPATLRMLGLAAATAGLAACASLGDPLPHQRAFPAGFQPPLSIATGKPVYGWGGVWQGDGAARTPGPDSPGHTPVLFIHGNAVDATYWNKARHQFKDAGWQDDELWAPSYGHASTSRFDSNDLTVPTLNAFVDEVQRYLAARNGRPVQQFDIVAHSLGVTAVRQWLTQTNRWHQVRNFIAVAGANHGVWTARPDARGVSRASGFELHRDSPWLAQLNAGGEVAGAARVMTLYDGTGRYDVLFPEPYEDSPALAGATNLAYNRTASGFGGGPWRGYGHLELPRKRATLAVIIDFLRAAHEPQPGARAPQLVRDGDVVRADSAAASLRCTADGRYPDLAATPPLRGARLQPGRWLTCFAHDASTGLSSPMARYGLAGATASGGDSTELTLSASPEAGPFEQPARVTLTASEPDALIVYSTAGSAPDSGAALYRGPIYIPAPVTLSAVAIAPDGRRSAPLRLRYDISLEYQDAVHTLQRQLDPTTPIRYQASNRSGD